MMNKAEFDGVIPKGTTKQTKQVIADDAPMTRQQRRAAASKARKAASKAKAR